MALWIHWRNAIELLRPAFSRTRTFMWFVTSVAGLSVRSDHLCVTSIVKQGHHLITRGQSNCVALENAAKRQGKPTRGRPSKYGAKIKLSNLYRSARKLRAGDLTKSHF